MSIKQKRVAQLMTPDVLTIDAGESLRAAAIRMQQKHVQCLIVPPLPPSACVGVITMKDIVQVLCDGDSAVLDQLLVGDAMSAPAVSVQQDFTISDCLRLMRMAGVRSVPVLDGVRLVGLLSWSDVLRAIVQEAGGTESESAQGSSAGA